jgi:hypothetical protein
MNMIREIGKMKSGNMMKQVAELVKKYNIDAMGTDLIRDPDMMDWIIRLGLPNPNQHVWTRCKETFSDESELRNHRMSVHKGEYSANPMLAALLMNFGILVDTEVLTNVGNIIKNDNFKHLCPVISCGKIQDPVWARFSWVLGLAALITQAGNLDPRWRT